MARVAEAVDHEAVAFYRALGRRIASVNGSVVLCSIGHAQLGTRVLSNLTEPCAGHILSYPDPAEQVTADLLWAVFAGASQSGAEGLWGGGRMLTSLHPPFFNGLWYRSQTAGKTSTWWCGSRRTWASFGWPAHP